MVFYDSKGNIIQVQSNGTLVNLDIDETNQGSIEHVDLMKDDYIEIQFNIKDPVYFPIGSYCKYNEKLYYVLDKQTPSVANTGLEYKLKLEAYYMKWKHVLFMYNKSNGGEAGWSLTGDINMFSNVLVHVLADEGLVYNGKAFSFVVDSTVTPDINTVDFSSVSVIEALNLIAEKFECEWWITDNIIHFGKCELGGDYTKLEVGEEIASCSCSSSSDSFANRIYAFGSDRNIPSTYRKHLQFNSDTIGTENGKTTVSDSTRPIKSTYFSGVSDTASSVQTKITFLTGNYKGKTYNATVNPDKAVNGGVIMLDAVITPSKTDTYSVEGLLSSQVPVSYYTADNDYVKNSVVQNRLALPVEKPYVDTDDITDKSNLNIDESDDIVPAIVVFDKEYPKLTSTIQSVSVEMIHYKDSDGNVLEEKYPQYTIVLDKPTDFDKKYIIKDSLKCAFQSGLLAGSEYELQFNSGSSFTIVNNSDYGRQLPDTVLVPKAGDTLILYNYDTEYFYSQTLSDAEQHLRQTAITYLAKKLVDPSTYSCKMGVLQDHDLELGEKVNLIAPEYIKSKIVDGVVYGRKSRIVGYEKALDGSSCTYTVGESTAYSRLNTLESKVDSIEYNGASYQYTGSGNGISLYLITSNDSTIPSDSNAFSAKRSRKEFLSKTGDERTEHSLSIGKDLTVDGDAFLNKVQSTDYIQDNTGYRFERDSNGNYKLSLKDLYVWGKMIVRELEIRKLSSIGGAVIISPCASTIIKVEKISAGYKCYIKQDDGTTHTTNGWNVGDQAKAQTFNVLKAGSLSDFSNGYYWRTVIEVNNSTDAGGLGYVVLSDTSKDKDSTEPQAGDVIVLDGVNADYYTAKVDSDTSHFPYERSNVILLDSSDGYGTIRIIDHVTDFVHDTANDTVNMSRKGVFIKASSFNFVSDDGTEVPPTVNYGPWSAKPFPYYAEVSYNGSLWLCIEKTGAKATDIPGANSNVWEEMVAKGDTGDQGKATLRMWITSDSGAQFVDGAGTKVLTAHISYGTTEITLDKGAYTWYDDNTVIDGENFQTISVGVSHIGNVTFDADEDAINNKIS